MLEKSESKKGYREYAAISTFRRLSSLPLRLKLPKLTRCLIHWMGSVNQRSREDIYCTFGSLHDFELLLPVNNFEVCVSEQEAKCPFQTKSEIGQQAESGI